MDHTRLLKKAIDSIGKDEKAMAFEHLRRSCLIWVMTLATALLIFGTGLISAQEGEPPDFPENAASPSPEPDEQEPVKGYPIRNRRIGGPTDVEWDLDNSFPKSGSVLELLLRCKKTPEQ